MNDTTSKKAPPTLALNESEALALIELLEDKGLLEFADATPELTRLFDKLGAFKTAYTGRWRQEQAEREHL